MKNGYGVIGLRSGGKSYTHYVHRIMWEQHNGQPVPEGMQVCHSCDNRICGNPEHLFLGTNQDNIDDKVAKGRQLKGVTMPTHKLTDDEVLEIRRLRKQGYVQRVLAERFGVSESAIWKIVTNGPKRTWKHLDDIESGYSHTSVDLARSALSNLDVLLE